MLSRTASHLFWMARYIERAENVTRIMNVARTFALMPESRGGTSEAALRGRGRAAVERTASESKPAAINGGRISG